MAMEFGRPGIATRLSELEKMTLALAKAGVHMEEKNPVTFLLADLATGAMRDDVKAERVLSAILEIEFDMDKLPLIVNTVKDVAPTLETVFSWGAFTRLDDDMHTPIIEVLEELGVPVRPNAKVNMGLGRPLVDN
jgi:hypothetical protein